MSTWTTDLPTKSGWYWLSRGSPPWITQVVKVECETDSVLYAGIDVSYTIKNVMATPCEWSGPIEPPRET